MLSDAADADTNLVVADRNGVAVFEVSPDQVVQRKPPTGGLCTNHFCEVDLGRRSR